MATRLRPPLKLQGVWSLVPGAIAVTQRLGTFPMMRTLLCAMDCVSFSPAWAIALGRIGDFVGTQIHQLETLLLIAIL